MDECQMIKRMYKLMNELVGKQIDNGEKSECV